MKFLLIILLTIMMVNLNAELDFCDKTVIVILSPSISIFNGGLHESSC